MKSPQERMNYIIKKLNIAKKSGGDCPKTRMSFHRN